MPRRSWMVILLAFLVTILGVQPAMAQLMRSHTYESMMAGFNQFPAPTLINSYVGVVESMYRSVCGHIKRYSNTECVRLGVITGERQLFYFSMEVELNDLAIFLHELRPKLGKYVPWYSVIALSKTPWGTDEGGRGFYLPSRIHFLGRFKVKWDEKDPDKVAGFENEIYWK